MAKAEASVEELVDMIEHGELGLPEMQRIRGGSEEAKKRVIEEVSEKTKTLP